MPERLHLVKVPLRAAGLAGVARRKHVPVYDVDEGYLAHCVMRELWQDAAPAPFLLRGRGRTLEAWGYSRTAADDLVARAQMCLPEQVACIEDLNDIASRPVPRLDPGRRIGFQLRACPVVRLASATHGHQAGAEVDAFLARCFSVPEDVTVAREHVYREWIARRLADESAVGAGLESVRVASMTRECLVRRTRGEVRHARRLERPDVRFEGVLVVSDPDRLLDCLARGIGRHRAFGFGAMMLVPPGSSWER